MADRLPHRRSLSRSLWPALLALLVLAGTFLVYVALEKRIDVANKHRQEALALVDQLRRSSDELTRMARTQVLTGDARFRQAFELIGAIRDGRAPWPEGYEDAYWDLLLAERRVPGRPGPTQALQERLRAAGLTAAELELLAESKAQSDALAQREIAAMDLAATGEAGAAQAREWLHGPDYHQAKAAIMAPIDQAQRSVRERSALAVAAAIEQAGWARYVFITMALGLLALMVRSRRALRRLMGGTVREVHARIAQIGRGDFTAPLSAGATDPGSMLGHLAQTQRQLQRLDSDRAQALQRLQLAAGVFTHAREGIMITDAQGLIVDVNEAFIRLTGYTREELMGRSPRLLDSGRHSPEYYQRLWQELQQFDQWQGEIWDRRKCGSLFASLETISAVRNAAGEVTHYITLMTDITALKEQTQRLEHIAHFDALTALPNRVLLGDRLKHAMRMAPRHGSRIALVYLDLDGFKDVNDLHGHEVGDRLLVELAARLRQVLREGDTLARLGGDEFVAVLLDLPDLGACETLLSRMLREIARPFKLDGKEVQVSGSLGVTHYPQAEEVDADQLLRQADQAMYQAKVSGKNRFQVFDTEAAAQVRGHLATVEGIRLGLAQRQLLLHYQPKVNLRSGRVVGAEALLRWQHPERGLLPPAQFLPVIEDHPLICEVGDWVIQESLAQMVVWRAQGLVLPLSVNVSARQLQQSDFIARVLQALQQHPGLQPQDLMLEVLETSTLEDLVGVSRTMSEGRAHGLAFSLDDFGTGYSSLTYLKRLPVAQLKIDQSFVRDMLDDADDLAILDGVIGLAAAFRREVIAEGVESAEHGTALLQLGCELAQGYGIARPMPAQELPAWVKRWTPAPEWQGLGMVSRENLALLRASMDHRARGRALLRYLRGQHEQAPSLEARDSRLAEWLTSPAGALPRFEPLRRRHAEVMRLGRVLKQRRARGDALERGPIAALEAAESELAQALRQQLNP